MRRTWINGLAVSLLLVLTVVVTPAIEPGTMVPGFFGAVLSGYQEVPPISTEARGRLTLEVKADEISFTFSYAGLEGGNPAAAHIHFGPRGVNGGVMAFLCGGSKPACPPSGTITGTIVAADVVGPTAQGIAAGEFEEMRQAIFGGVSYVNIHNATYPGGEMRGAIVRGLFLPPLPTE